MTVICLTTWLLLAAPAVKGATDAGRHTCSSFTLARLGDPTTVMRVTITRSATAPCKSIVAKVRTLTATEYPLDSPAQRVDAKGLPGGWDCRGDAARLMCRGNRRHPGYNTLRVPGVAEAQGAVATKTVVDLPRPTGRRLCPDGHGGSLTVINLSCAQSSKVLRPFSLEWHQEAINYVTGGPDGPVGDCLVIHVRTSDRAVVVPAIVAGQPDLARIGDRPAILDYCRSTG